MSGLSCGAAEVLHPGGPISVPFRPCCLAALLQPVSVQPASVQPASVQPASVQPASVQSVSVQQAEPDQSPALPGGAATSSSVVGMPSCAALPTASDRRIVDRPAWARPVQARPGWGGVGGEPA
jgi:hypothetical protein